jgi:hypothetical protein
MLVGYWSHLVAQFVGERGFYARPPLAVHTKPDAMFSLGISPGLCFPCRVVFQASDA